MNVDLNNIVRKLYLNCIATIYSNGQKKRHPLKMNFRFKLLSICTE